MLKTCALHLRLAPLAILATGLTALPASSHALSLAALYKPRLSGPIPVAVGATAPIAGSGLYDASGTLITSSVSTTGGGFQMDAWASAPPQQYNSINAALSGAGAYFPTTIYVYFSNSTWTSYGSATFALNAVNAYVASGRRGGIVSVAPFDWFRPFAPVTPPALNPALYADGTGATGLHSSLAYGDVNPRTFTVSDLTVDPNDTTGRTGYVRYLTYPGGPVPGNGFPWDNTPDAPRNPEGAISLVWFFPRVGYPGAWNGERPLPNWPLVAIE